MCIYIYIYIYIQRERERCVYLWDGQSSDRGGGSKRGTGLHWIIRSYFCFYLFFCPVAVVKAAAAVIGVESQGSIIV